MHSTDAPYGRGSAAEDDMRQIQLSIPEVAFIAGTRGALGAGLGLLAAGRMNQTRRRAIGWALLAAGALATIPAAQRVLGRRLNGTPAEKLKDARSAVPATHGVTEVEYPLGP